MSCITSLGTSGCSYNCLVVVTKLCNSFLSYKNFITYRAVLTFSKTCFCTSGSLSCVDYFGVTVCLNCFAAFCLSTTISTSKNCGGTRFGTGGSYRCCGLLHIVAFSCDFFCVRIATRTGVCFNTGFGTGGLFGNNACVVVVIAYNFNTTAITVVIGIFKVIMQNIIVPTHSITVVCAIP